MSPPAPATQTEATVRSLAAAAQLQLDELCQRPGEPVSGSALDQAGLRDGANIIAGYLEHGEPGVAFQHLLYMLTEPPLEVTRAQLRDIESVGVSLGVKPAAWQRVRVRGEESSPSEMPTSFDRQR